MASCITWPAPCRRSAISRITDHRFTDVRLKRFLEMRGADAGSAEMMVAQSALWVGLLYDDAALSAAESLLRGVGHGDVLALRAAVPRQGLETPFRGGTCATSRVRWWPLRRMGCGRAVFGTPPAPTRQPIWHRWKQSPPAARPRRNIGWHATAATGMVTQVASSPKRRSRPGR